MSREQELVAAFGAAIRECGLRTLKSTSMFGRSIKVEREREDTEKLAA